MAVIDRSWQSDYYATLTKSGSTGTNETFVEFTLGAIRDSIFPFANPTSGHELGLPKTLDFFKESPKGNINLLALHLGCSKRTAEHLVTELMTDDRLARADSSRADI